MKRHTQAIGVRKWAGGDLLELQSQPLEAIDRFFGQYGPCIVQGCKVTANGATADIAPGVVALNGQDATGAEVFMVAPFEGINGTSLPVYLKLTYTVRSRIYTDGAVKPIAYDYKATATTIRPIDSTPYLEITATGGNRFTDVIQDGKHRFITDAERTTWNDKETPTGAQSKATKALSDAKSYAAGLDSATNSLLSTHTSNTEKHITPAERTTWNDKASKAVVTAASDGLMSKADKTKLDGVATGANNYTHPATHPATIITENTTRRFITDAERIAWNDKASKAVVTAATDGLMSKVDKTKLDGIMAGANNYTHPAAHSATIITEDTTHRFVTDVEKEAWNSKATGTMATPTTNGVMSKEDKVKLDGVAPQANNYAHPSSHPATIITPDATHRFVTDSEKANWNAKASTAVATTSASGLLSGTDKAKLDGIDSGANYYSHPSSHPATIITPDATHRFVTDAEKTTWNAKASTTVANGTTDGLMSTRHWSKLMGIDEGANYYTHPTTHPATIITPDATHRFVTDAEKTTWNAKETAAGAQAKANIAELNALRDSIIRRQISGAVMGKGLFSSTDSRLLAQRPHTTAILFITPSTSSSTLNLYTEGAGGTHGVGFFIMYIANTVYLNFRGLEITSKTVAPNTLCLAVASYNGSAWCIGSINNVSATKSNPAYVYQHQPEKFLLGGMEIDSANNSLPDIKMIAARRFDFAMSTGQITEMWNNGHPELWTVPESYRSNCIIDLSPGGLFPEKWVDTSGQGIVIPYIPASGKSAKVELSYDTVGFPAIADTDITTRLIKYANSYDETRDKCFANEEMLSNNSGSYVKFPSGLMIQWGKQQEVEWLPITVTFPLAFSSSSIFTTCTATYSNAYDLILQNLMVRTFSTTTMEVLPVKFNNGGPETYKTSFYWIAIGRWK